MLMEHSMQSVADFHCKNHGGVQLEQRHILSIPSQVSPGSGSQAARDSDPASQAAGRGSPAGGLPVPVSRSPGP
jgi:hypothetical protein